MRKSVSTKFVGLWTTYDVTTAGDDCMSLGLEAPRQKQVYTDSPFREKVQTHFPSEQQMRYKHRYVLQQNLKSRCHMFRVKCS